MPMLTSCAASLLYLHNELFGDREHVQAVRLDWHVAHISLGMIILLQHLIARDMRNRELFAQP